MIKMNHLLLVFFLTLAGLFAFSAALCTNTGGNCHDTGCRLHGGHCNSACQCMQRQNLYDFRSHDSL